tara:strand:- start:1343 stop:2212 length:870 start_codon:yes stop_codon:yes gene_type:complete
MKKILNYFLIFNVIFLPLFFSKESNAFEIDYIKKIKDRGSLIVGMPPYNNPPYYYKESPPSVSDSDSMKGNDVEIIRKFAKNLGVGVIFDQSSTSFNETVNRAGAGDFDLAIGKLSINYSRMSNAHPHVYMNFRQSLLANRSFLSNFANVPDSEFGKKILESNLKVGFIANSSYETSANQLMPNATKKGYSSWDECLQALKKGDVDAIYRDATEIKKIVYKDPNLSIKFVPILFDDVKDKIAIYLSTEANIAMSDVLNFYLEEEEVKTDTDVLNEFSDYYQPISTNNKA